MPPVVLVVAPPLTARNLLADSADVTALAKRMEPTRDRVGAWPGKPCLKCCAACLLPWAPLGSPNWQAATETVGTVAFGL